jgi:hypothetical protein
MARFESAVASLKAVKVDTGYNVNDYDNSRAALDGAIAYEDKAWTIWRDGGQRKDDHTLRDAQDASAMWEKHARRINKRFPEIMNPDDVQIFFTALCSYSKPIPEKLAEIRDTFRKGNVGKDGRMYGERAIKNMKMYAVAVSVFEDYENELVDALKAYLGVKA